MLRNDIIEEAHGPTEWLSSIVVVPKSNSQDVRICVDMSPVKNNLSEWHRFDIACHHRLLIVFRIVFRNRKRYRFDSDIAIVITYRFVCIETMSFMYCYDIV